ncbi:MAG: AbrB/MazE/SpoVT family DNA-binding domain-containing protein [Microthrixaceae bacterium]|nr:AbrB/MazE/SpoVT family DNA-binding domain-containing protein [Microthrixaceae bacterium]
MKVTMDRAGRVVLPKSIRDLLGLEPDEELDIAVDGTGIRLQPRSRPRRQLVEVDGWPVIGSVIDHVTTDADVQALRDADRR